MVKSLSFDIFQKYGVAKPEPKVVLFVSDGASKPDLLLTVGSGCENFGEKKIGKS